MSHYLKLKTKTFSVQGTKKGMGNQDGLRFFQGSPFFQGNLAWDVHLHSSQISLSFDEFSIGDVVVEADLGGWLFWLLLKNLMLPPMVIRVGF